MNRMSKKPSFSRLPSGLTNGVVLGEANSGARSPDGKRLGRSERRIESIDGNNEQCRQPKHDARPSHESIEETIVLSGGELVKRQHGKAKPDDQVSHNGKND